MSTVCYCTGTTAEGAALEAHKLLPRSKTKSLVPLILGRGSAKVFLIHKGSSFCSALRPYVVTAWFLTIMYSTLDGPLHIEGIAYFQLFHIHGMTYPLKSALIVTVVNNGMRELHWIVVTVTQPQAL